MINYKTEHRVYRSKHIPKLVHMIIRWDYIDLILMSIIKENNTKINICQALSLHAARNTEILLKSFL